jgi:hypothetical protein
MDSLYMLATIAIADADTNGALTAYVQSVQDTMAMLKHENSLLHQTIHDLVDLTQKTKTSQTPTASNPA